jgi:Polyketide cyclase / dehydrase and lipid transport
LPGSERKSYMINLNISTIIFQPIQQVFDFVSTPENDFQWQYGTLASARLSEEVGNQLGTFFRSIGHLLGHRNLSTFEVLAYEPNQKYKFKSLSGPLHLQTTYIFEEADENTKINISIKAHVPNFFQMDEGMMASRMKKQLRENLAMLKDILEARRISPALEPNLLLI